MSALGQTALGQLALGEAGSTAQTIVPALFTNTNTFYTHVVIGGVQTILPDLFVDPDIFYRPTVFVPTIFVPEQRSAFSGVAPPPFPRPRLDAVAKGDIITCFVRLIPGKAQTMSLLPGLASGSAIVEGTKEIRSGFLYIVGGDAEGEMRVSDEEIETLLLILAEAA